MTHPSGNLRTLTALLNAGETVPVREAIQWVAGLAVQVSQIHASGRIHRGITPAAITLDSNSSPALCETSDVLHGADIANVREWSAPALGDLSPANLPEEINAAQLTLQQAGLSLDVRQIDIYPLGVLLCRLVTGESPAAYLRSPRVKGHVPLELRSVLESALAIDGRERIVDILKFASELNALSKSEPPITAFQPAIATDESPALSVTESTSGPKAATGDTKPSVVGAPDTTIGPRQPDTEPGVAGDEIPFTKLGHFEILGRIGRGGMGDVYRGYERGLDRTVALKVLPADLARQDDFVRRFKAEATAAAKLVHPNIIQIYFIGEDNGHHYFAMQFVSGESLAELLYRRGRLNVDEALAIIEQALLGLDSAHQQGLVHRDIKPGNILLDREHRRALLADFGLVKTLETSGTGHTATGVIMGTVDYISPEQGRGMTVDGRSDLYSFGVLMYQMLSSKLPFEGTSPTALIFQHVYELAPSLVQIAPHVPTALAAIISKMMQKAPANRYQTVEELLADLRAFRAGRPLPSKAEFQTAPDVPVRSARNSMVFESADLFADEPTLNYEPADVKIPGWWEQAQVRARSLFWRHAPDVIQRLQNTQQQLDGSVARYARQERELRRLSEEAEQVLQELQFQAREHRRAADQARVQAKAGTRATAIHVAQAEEITATQNAMGFERQASEQLEQMDVIKLRLAKIVSKRQQLESQRDILNARLKMAGVRVAVESGLTKRPAHYRGRQIVGALLAVLLLTTAVWNSKARSRANQVLASPGTSSSIQQSLVSQNRESAVPLPTDLLATPRHRLSQQTSMRGIAFDPSSSRLAVLRDKKIDNYEFGSWRQMTEIVQNFNGETGLMRLSPDWQILAVDSANPLNGTLGHQIQLYSKESGELLRSTPQFDQPASSLTFSRDGKFLAAIHIDENEHGHLSVWGTQGVTKLRELETEKKVGPAASAVAQASLPVARLGDADLVPRLVDAPVQSNVRSVSFHPQGRWIACGTADGQIQLFDLSNGKLLKTFQGHTHAVQALAIIPNGTALVSGDQQGHLLLWDTESGQQLGRFPAHSDGIDSLEIAPNGLYLASSDALMTAIWDLSTGIVRTVLPTKGKTQLAFDSTGQYLATAEAKSGLVTIWDAELHPAPVVDNNYSTEPFDLRAWNIKEPTTNIVEVDPSKVIFASGNELLLYQRKPGAPQTQFGPVPSPIRAISLSTDRQTVVTGCDDGSIRFWDVKSGSMIFLQTTSVSGKEKAQSIRQVLVSPDGQLAAAATVSSLFIADRQTSEPLNRFECSLEQVAAMAWLPGAKRQLLVGGRDPASGNSRVLLLNISERSIQSNFNVFRATIEWLSVSNDGKSFLCAAGGSMRTVAIPEGTVTREWHIPDASGSAIARSPEGSLLAIAEDRQIRLWDLDLGYETRRFTVGNRSARIRELGFTADGQRLLSLDENLRLERAFIKSTPLLFSNSHQLILNSQPHLHWIQAARSRAGREALTQSLELFRNPGIHLKGPTGDPDLADFSTDGGWWVNHGMMVRQPGAKRAILDLGTTKTLKLTTRFNRLNTNRLFFFFGWNGQRGYCLAKQPFDKGENWILTSLPDGETTQFAVPENADQSNVPQSTSLKLQVSGNSLTLWVESMEKPIGQQKLADVQSGRLLMGIVDGRPGDHALKIIECSLIGDAQK